MEIDKTLEYQIGRGLRAWADQLTERDEVDLRATLAATCGELFRRHGGKLPADLHKLAGIFEAALKRGAN